MKKQGKSNTKLTKKIDFLNSKNKNIKLIINLFILQFLFDKNKNSCRAVALLNKGKIGG